MQNKKGNPFIIAFYASFAILFLNIFFSFFPESLTFALKLIFAAYSIFFLIYVIVKRMKFFPLIIVSIIVLNGFGAGATYGYGRWYMYREGYKSDPEKKAIDEEYKAKLDKDLKEIFGTNFKISTIAISRRQYLYNYFSSWKEVKKQTLIPERVNVGFYSGGTNYHLALKKEWISKALEKNKASHKAILNEMKRAKEAAAAKKEEKREE